jgi:D-sedoheptulose 7-phosphate isomerase
MNKSDRRNHIEDYLTMLHGVLNELSRDQIEAVFEVFEQAYHADRTIFICGNGGSAATASHWVCDYAKGTVSPKARRLRMISLGDNAATLTAYANDVGYNVVFSEPIRTFVRQQDVVVLITASGNSPNILEAARAAKEVGAITVGLIGFGGGKLSALVDYQITVSCREYGPVEDLHMVLDHITSLYMRKIIAESAE